MLAQKPSQSRSGAQKGWPRASIVGAINVPNTHLVKGHCGRNSRGKSKNKEIGHICCTYFSCPKLLKRMLVNGNRTSVLRKPDQWEINYCKFFLYFDQLWQENWCRQCFLSKKNSFTPGRYLREMFHLNQYVLSYLKYVSSRSLHLVQIIKPRRTSCSLPLSSKDHA